jgi:hypothetical protein
MEKYPEKSRVQRKKINVNFFHQGNCNGNGLCENHLMLFGYKRLQCKFLPVAGGKSLLTEN